MLVPMAKRIKITVFWLVEDGTFIFRVEVPYVLNITPAGSTETFHFEIHHRVGSPSLSLRMHDFMYL